MKRWVLIPAVVVAIAIFAATALLAGRRGNDDASNGESLAGIYVRYQGRIYMNIPGEGYFLLPSADAASFAALNGLNAPNLGRDRESVYCGSVVIPGLHPEQVSYANSKYVSDGKRAWYCSSEKDNQEYRWWQDFTRSDDQDNPDKPRRRDYTLVQLASQDVAALKVLAGAYAQDGAHAFYEGRLIPGAQGESMQTLKLGWGSFAGRTDESYARDNQHVYFEGVTVPQADPDSFSVLAPENGPARDVYGLDRSTGRFYYGAQPFPATVDGKDSSALNLLIADRERANQELFYNASGFWYWDYRKNALELACANPFAGTPTMFTPGAWSDGHNTFVLRAIEERAGGKSDHSLQALKTRVLMVRGLATAQWTKADELLGTQGQSRGTLWRAGSGLFFAPSVGQNNFLDDALYVVLDPDGLKRDLLSNQYYLTIFKAKDLRRLDSSESDVVCEAASRY